MQVDVTVDIDKPAEIAFDLMADARNEPSWNTRVTATELTTAEPVGPGTSFTTIDRGRRFTAVITDYDRPRRLTFEVRGKPFTITARMHFTEARGSTRLDATFDMRPHGFMKILLPLMSPAVRKDFPRQFDGFKQFCEARP